METDWRALIDRDDIDLIDIAAPNDVHHDIAIAAAQAGKMVMCEKPLGRSAAESAEMVAAVEKAGVPNMVWYNYRRIPAVSLAKKLIDDGQLGRIFHYRAKFLQDWTIAADLPQGGEGLWRLDKSVAGSGVTGDLLAHCIDTAMWLNGGINSVTAMTETFIKEREHTLTGKVEKVGIDDACAFLARFDNGSLATFESTRYARGHKALYTLEINGEHASIFWDLHDLHRLEYFDHRDEGQTRGWRSVHITDGDHPYMDKWWVPGLSHRLRRKLHPPGRRFHRRSGRRWGGTDIRGCAPNGQGHRRGAEIRRDRSLGNRRVGWAICPPRRKERWAGLPTLRLALDRVGPDPRQHSAQGPMRRRRFDNAQYPTVFLARHLLYTCWPVAGHMLAPGFRVNPRTASKAKGGQSCPRLAPLSGPASTLRPYPRRSFHGASPATSTSSYP